jgi:hypothetical protein
MNRKEQLELLEALTNMYMLVGQASPDAFKNDNKSGYSAPVIIGRAKNILECLGVAIG